MSVKKEELKGGAATNIQDGNANPNEIEKFVDWKADRVTVYTTEKVKKHYPKTGTAVALEANKAEKWIKKGYATKDAPKEGGSK